MTDSQVMDSCVWLDIGRFDKRHRWLTEGWSFRKSKRAICVVVHLKKRLALSKVSIRTEASASPLTLIDCSRHIAIENVIRNRLNCSIRF